MGETRRIEWPPRSGSFAEYTPEEERFLRSLVAGCEAGAMTEEQLGLEVGIFHDLKATLAARTLGDGDPSLYDDRGYEPVELPSPDSDFQIPGRAAEALAAHDPQLSLG